MKSVSENDRDHQEIHKSTERWELSLYKEKLIELVREHSALLAICSSSHDHECEEKNAGNKCVIPQDSISSYSSTLLSESNTSTYWKDAVAARRSAFSQWIHSIPGDVARVALPVSDLQSLLRADDDGDDVANANINSGHDSRGVQYAKKTKASGPHVRVGVGVLVKDPKAPSKIFAGIRKGSHGAGTLALPGGHLEIGESWEACAAREVEEEMGLRLQNVRFAHVTNDPMSTGEATTTTTLGMASCRQGGIDRHYVTIFMSAEVLQDGGAGDAVPKNLEPGKCEGWSSYGWDELVSLAKSGEDSVLRGSCKRKVRLFQPLLHLVESSPPSVLEFLSL